MPVTFAEVLYTEWRRRQTDPTEHPAYGNLDADQRAVWDHVVFKATLEVATRIEQSIRLGNTPDDIRAAELVKAWRPI